MRAGLYLVLIFMIGFTGYVYFFQPEHASEGIPSEPQAARESAERGKIIPAVEEVAPVTQPPDVTPHTEAITSEDAEPGKEERVSVEPMETGVKESRLSDGVALFDGGRYRDALDIFLKLSPREPRALTGAGLSYFKLGDYENAIGYLKRAAESGQDEFLARKFLALSYYKTDDLAGSRENAARALAIRSDPELEDFLEKLSRESALMDGDYIVEETLHFRVIFDGYLHGGISREVLRILEDAYRGIGGRLNHYPDGTVTVLLYTQKDFFGLTGLPPWTAGAYDGKIRLPIGGIEAGDYPALEKVLYHEYLHALVHSLTPQVPAWINEGLAEVLVDRGLGGSGQRLPLGSLENGFPLGDQVLMTMAYQESYSAVSGLVERHGLYAMTEFLRSLSRGENLNEAFLAAFGLTYNDFVASWGTDGGQSPEGPN